VHHTVADLLLHLRQTQSLDQDTCVQIRQCRLQ
jgi:hypothetical protein